MRALLDTNVLVSALVSPHGAPAAVYESWQNGQFEMLCSPSLFTEYSRVLTAERLRRFIARPELVADALEAIRTLTIWVEASDTPADAVRDPSDVHVLGAAVGGRADVLVSGDQDLLAVREYMGVRILNPSQFLDELRAP